MTVDAALAVFWQPVNEMNRILVLDVKIQWVFYTFLPLNVLSILTGRQTIYRVLHIYWTASSIFKVFITFPKEFQNK